MAILTVRELYTLLSDLPRDVIGVRMVYDGDRLSLIDENQPNRVFTQKQVDGVKEAAWDLTAFAVSLDTVKAWLRMQEDGEQRVGISPFWGGGDYRVVFTGCGAQFAFSVISLPSAPRASSPGAP